MTTNQKLNLIPEDENREEYLRWKENKLRQQRRDENREAYKQLVDKAVLEIFPYLQTVSEKLTNTKQEVYNCFADAIALKEDVFNSKTDQTSNTFSSSCGNYRITLGYHQVDAYDDTVNEGIAKVKKFIEDQAKDDGSKLLVSAVLKLLARDAKGTLKASRVVQLRKMANDSGNADFIDGVDIIEKAYRPERSKQYVRAEYKNDIDKWITVPLGMTEA